MQPFDGGPTPGWSQYVAWTTIRSDWLRRAVLEEALSLFHEPNDEPPAADEDSEPE